MSVATVLARAMPRSLTARVLLIILAGLVLAHAASLALFAIERSRAADRFAAADVAARVIEYSRSPIPPPPIRLRLQSSKAESPGAPPPSGRGFSGASAGDFRLRWRLQWTEVQDLGDPPPSGRDPSGVFDAELRRLLTESLGSDPVAWTSMRAAPRPAGAPKMPPHGEGISPGRRFERPDGGRPAMSPPGMRPQGGEREAMLVTVALALPGGRKALAESFVFTPSLSFPAEAWVSVLLLFVVTALFSIWAVWLAVQPLRMLSDAAERLSRNLDEPPLAEKGAAEIRVATRAFNRMQDRLRRHVASRTLSFAAMSHDVRTPLTRLRLKLESMDPEQRARIEGDIGEIEAIAQAVLQMARDLSPEESVRQVDVMGLVRRLLDDDAPLGRPIELTGSCVPIAARPAALRRALANLLDNAIKYGDRVSIEITDSPEQAGIHVCDRGPGIPEEHLPHVVLPFYRVDSSRNRDTGGTGLGLAIAKDIVEGHGGTLTLRNRSGGGLCATISLPR